VGLTSLKEKEEDLPATATRAKRTMVILFMVDLLKYFLEDEDEDEDEDVVGVDFCWLVD
jgi:hypothetical protein